MLSLSKMSVGLCRITTLFRSDVTSYCLSVQKISICHYPCILGRICDASHFATGGVAHANNVLVQLLSVLVILAKEMGQNVVLQSDAMLSSIERHYTPINKNSTGKPLFPIEHTSSWNLCDLLYQFLQPLQYQSAVTRSSWITCIKHLGLEDIVVSTKKT